MAWVGAYLHKLYVDWTSSRGCCSLGAAVRLLVKWERKKENKPLPKSDGSTNPT